MKACFEAQLKEFDESEAQKKSNVLVGYKLTSVIHETLHESCSPLATQGNKGLHQYTPQFCKVQNTWILAYDWNGEPHKIEHMVGSLRKTKSPKLSFNKFLICLMFHSTLSPKQMLSNRMSWRFSKVLLAPRRCSAWCRPSLIWPLTSSVRLRQRSPLGAWRLWIPGSDGIWSCAPLFLPVCDAKLRYLLILCDMSVFQFSW